MSPLGPVLGGYSPECVEGGFCEVELRVYAVLRSSRSPDPFGHSFPKSRP